MYLKWKYITSPQGVEVLPAVLAFFPRYARSTWCPGVQPTARHKGVVDHRERVAMSPFYNNYSETMRRMRVYQGDGKVGSCSLQLLGRLQPLFQPFHLLQLLSNLRSEDFKQVIVVLILFTCTVSWSAGGGFNFPKEEEEEDHCCGGRHPRCCGHCLCEAGIMASSALRLANFLRASIDTAVWMEFEILTIYIQNLIQNFSALLDKIKSSVKRKIVRIKFWSIWGMLDKCNALATSKNLDIYKNCFIKKSSALVLN